jgi:hypothetical protein
MSITFNGSSSKATWAGQLYTGLGLSLFGWIKPSSNSTDYFACGAGNTGGTEEISCYVNGASTTLVRAFLKDGAGNLATGNSTDSIVTSWQPFLLTWSSDNHSAFMYYKVYADGSTGGDPGTLGVSLTFANLNRFAVGVRGISDTFWFNGDIAEIAAWSSVIGSSDATSLFGGAKPETIQSGTLIDAWSLADSSTLTGVNGRTLTGANLSTGATHPITRTGSNLVSLERRVGRGSFRGQY